MTDQTITLNQNATACIRSTANVGSTTYQNICDGTSSAVPWGSADWLEAVAVGGLALLGAVAISAIAAAILRLVLSNDF